MSDSGRLMGEDCEDDVDPFARPDEPKSGSLWRHHKTGGTYRVVCCADVEATRERVVVYEGTFVRGMWTRPLDEFRERFYAMRDVRREGDE